MSTSTLAQSRAGKIYVRSMSSLWLHRVVRQTRIMWVCGPCEVESAEFGGDSPRKSHVGGVRAKEIAAAADEPATA